MQISLPDAVARDITDSDNANVILVSTLQADKKDEILEKETKNLKMQKHMQKKLK